MTQVSALIHPLESGEFWTEVPSLPGCVSQGPTMDDSLANTRAAIRQWLAYLRDQGKETPLPEDFELVIERTNPE